MVDASATPRHVAIIMDGNGRWAQRRGQPRGFGHRAGGKAARQIIEACEQRAIDCLTLFAFSAENWGRPESEVGLLMDLFLRTLRKDLTEFRARGARIQFIGDRSGFGPELRQEMQDAEQATRDNPGLQLNVAVGYGGQQDIVKVTRELAREVAEGALRWDEIDHDMLTAALALGEQPAPDLFIRTGGELRISNFLLWQLAYTELYFTDVLWPDFSPAELDQAIAWFAQRDRRFGLVSPQQDSNVRHA